MNYFVTAIGTDSGKTLVSAILCKALHADYWKPVQAGFPRDTETVESLVPEIKTHPEAYLLNTPESPHASARKDGVTIDLNKFKLPETSGALIIEGAGGLMVPLNDQHFVIDLIEKLNSKVILVSDLYLGSINHTLLTVQALKSRRIPVVGIVFNGQPNPESESVILTYSGWKFLFRILPEEKITPEIINQYAKEISLHD